MTQQALYQGPLLVKKSPIHGYGVFASTAIEKDQVIEECHPLFLPQDSDFLINYSFQAGEESAIPLGFACIYNHSPTPNISYTYAAETKLFGFRALRLIQHGTA